MKYIVKSLYLYLKNWCNTYNEYRSFCTITVSVKKRSEPFAHFWWTLVWTHSINMLPKQVAHINQASLHMQLFIARSKLYNWGRKVIECYTNSSKRNASGTSLDYWIKTNSLLATNLHCQFYSSCQKVIVAQYFF